MFASTPTDIEQVVTTIVADRLQLGRNVLDLVTDLRDFRSFSSFKAVTILEDLERRLDVEIPSDRIRAERLCSVASLTVLFTEAVAERDEAAS